jgi:uncharacterized protein YdeI (YjbR/CyaY-like superfamily)
VIERLATRSAARTGSGLQRDTHGDDAWQAELIVAADLPVLIVADATRWRDWLAEHQGSAGVWLVLAKKGTSAPTSLRYGEALEEALCHGWIDGQVGPGDDATYRQRFTPRRARSSWSKRNVAIAARLLTEGRMHPAGIAEIERAKTDGRWEAAYAGSASIEVPADLAQALAAEPQAQALFEALTRQNRYAILYRIATVKRAETRARRIEQFVAMLREGQTIHPQKRK